MKWMFRDTMGAADEFGFRVAELAQMTGVDPACIADEMVVDSYLDSVQPGGYNFEYLFAGVLAHVQVLLAALAGPCPC